MRKAKVYLHGLYIATTQMSVAEIRNAEANGFTVVSK